MAAVNAALCPLSGPGIIHDALLGDGRYGGGGSGTNEGGVVAAVTNPPSPLQQDMNCCKPPYDISGKQWCESFKDTNDIAGLSSDHNFKANFTSFYNALLSAIPKPTVNITSVRRLPQRQYLMYTSWLIHNGTNPANVAVYSGPGDPVLICWNHQNAKAAADDMWECFGHPTVVGQSSNHTAGLAVDMNVSWTGTMTVPTPAGPQQVSTQYQLWQIANNYFNVVHYYYPTGVDPKGRTDDVHWSWNGR